MKDSEVLKEIEGFEKKSNLNNRINILFYSLLKLLNNESSYLLISLMSTFLSCFIFGFSYLFGLLAHFTVWISFRSQIVDTDKCKKENSDIDLIISTIKKHLNKKNEK